MSNAAPSLIVEALMDADRRDNLTPGGDLSKQAFDRLNKKSTE